jgi:hypothetical protein
MTIMFIKNTAFRTVLDLKENIERTDCPPASGLGRSLFHGSEVFEGFFPAFGSFGEEVLDVHEAAVQAHRFVGFVVGGGEF